MSGRACSCSPVTKRARELAKILVPPLREVARRHGYALATHGSMGYDIDLVAIPWRTGQCDPATVAEAMRAAAAAIVGEAVNLDDVGENHDYAVQGAPGLKPHGRLCWSFHLGGGPYIDLSVIPAPPEQAEAPTA